LTKTPTPLQQAIFEELDKYTSIENMRENAQTIADKVAERDSIKSCSKTYVLRMIKRREDSSAKVQFRVEPVKSEEPESEEPEQEFTEDDWDFDAEEEEEESNFESTEKIQDIPIEELIDAKATKTLMTVPFRMAADWTGYEGFKLTAEEEKQLIPVIRPLLIKYVPDIFGEFFAEIICAFVVLSILGPKMKGYREFQEDKKKSAIAQARAEKSAKEVEEREQRWAEQRRLELEEQKRSEQQTMKIDKDDPENTPAWLDKGRHIG